MKVLLVNGSPNENGCTYTALSEIKNTLKDNDIESEILYLGKSALNDCIACGKCRETGKCVFNDIVNETVARLDEFDGIIVGSPVYYAGPTGRVCSFLDRLFYSASAKLQSKFAASIVSCRRGGASSSFDRLNKYFTINNMPLVPSQYWNSVHGNTPEEVKKDIEGLQTMRTLANNMAWLLKSNKIAKENGISKPDYENQIYTNFIR
ncbi:flavodoxin family protein [Peptostreptococcus russellii]|uniref:flavodoxin family protein n=1 Tax=Peptostreptococcus russellii TaxID=215200 RepID=UPI003F58F2DC